ncbi:MAG: C25 family cysteine peptidase [Chitinophagaceae bacterium]|nr:C25 family cysteine peptidase [Chitinophagaceae bacterium]
MKKILFFIFTVFVGVFVKAQPFPYGNEWIDYNKTYYKFKLASNGLYRISQPVLAAAGLGGVPAEHFQLWRNGQQVPIYTSKQSGVFGSSDYIEFWGEMNDGKPDKDLYRNPNEQLNDKWSLETDTATYFLTVNTTGNNLRLMPTPNALPTTLTPEPYFLHTVGKYFRDKYHFGYAAVVGEYVFSSNYEGGEGFTSTDMGPGAVRSENFTNLFPYTGSGAPSPEIIIHAAGYALNPRSFDVRLNNTVVATQNMGFFEIARVSFPFSVSLLSSGTALLEIKNNATSADRMVVAKMELRYPRQFNFGGANNFYFELPANNNGNYLEISGFNHGSINPVLYDLTNGKRYVCDISTPGLVKVVLQPSSVPRKLVLVTQVSTYPISISNLQPKTFLNFSQPAHHGNYLIISHPAFLTSSNGLNPLELYRSYRASSLGGSFNAKIYFIDELVDQFAYGIKNHPLSVRNFLRWARVNFNLPIKYVFIIGKGLHYIHNHQFQSHPDINKLSFVPTFGHPASDNLLAADPGADVSPKLPIGRLSVINGDEVLVYLNKVKEYEQKLNFQSPLIRDKLWHKNVVHVIGASDGLLGNILTNSMNVFTNIIKDTFYGANVHTFTKVSTAPVEQLNAARLYNLFEEGIGFMTYFGHSSASTLEFNLDNPDSYNNPGKYPLFILLGCNASNFYTFNPARLAAKETISERFVLASNRGSIATMASTHLGIVHYLDILHSQTMHAVSTTHYGQPIGDILLETIRRVFNTLTQNDFFARFHCEQTTIHGDPALKLNQSAEKPDYIIEDPLVEINPSFISVAENSFTIKAKCMNLGKALNVPVVVELKRVFPDNSVQIRRDTIAGIRFLDSVVYNIPIVASRDKGLNKIAICIDPDNKIAELFETNNCVNKEFFIFEDEIRPVYPFNYSIVNKQGIKFQASTANPFLLSRQYRMELDTTELFNSPLKVSVTATSSGGVVEFNPNITFTDSTVYYWRVAPVVTSGSTVWNYASFIYLANHQSGFNQSHYFQHTYSQKNKIQLLPQNRQWVFDSVPHFIFAKNGVFLTATTQEGDLIVAPDGNPFIRSGCLGSSLIFNLFDPKSFEPRLNCNGFMGSALPCAGDCNTSSRRWNFEWRYTDTAGRRRMMEFMDWIPDSTIVVVRNLVNSLHPPISIPQWMADTMYYGSNNSLYHRLKNAGLTLLDSMNSLRVMIFIYQKGNPSFGPVSIISNGIYDVIALNKNFKTIDSLGTITSPLYGRAKSWKQLIWQGISDNQLDTAYLDVIGVRNNGTEQLVMQRLSSTLHSVDISSINASEFPYLKLRLNTKDKGKYTPYQLRYWRVTFDPVPEGAIAPNLFFSGKDSLELGEPMNYKIAFKNVSEVPFDSMKVRMVITDRNNVPHQIPIPRRRPLPVNDTLQIGATVQSSAFPGRNTVYIMANPDNDQPEQFYFNNFAYRSLYVKPDSLNPLLDVTFDGVRILNGDIVSSKPHIVVKLKDESRWMLLDDTSLLTVQIRYPNGSLRRFYFNNDTLRFTPAAQPPNSDNTATVDFRPYFSTDGDYELIVQGKDKSNNTAGAMEYRVRFRVINKPMISNLLNYPNPFTTSTAFVFTITGSEVPQNLKIEIMTVTGKIVREITKEELGPLHIGRNITRFKWDGTDQFGQKLANGVYLYRVVTNLNGKSLEKYRDENDNTDKFFTRGYGKMYLMR